LDEPNGEHIQQSSPFCQKNNKMAYEDKDKKAGDEKDKKAGRALLGRENGADLVGSGLLAGVVTKVFLKETTSTSMKVAGVTGLGCVASGYAEEWMVSSGRSYSYSPLVTSFVVPTLVAAAAIKLMMSSENIVQKSLIAGGSCAIVGMVMRFNFPAVPGAAK